MAQRFIQRLRDLLDVSTDAAVPGDALVLDTDGETWVPGAGGGGAGAPDDATYLVTTANPDLSAEVVVGATPGGELGGTWASPTVDATHSGSSHAAVQAAAEATAAAALATHEGASDPHPGYTTAAELVAYAQPVDSDLTAIAALSTTAFGRGLLELANAAALLSAAGAAAATHVHDGGDITSGTVADARIASTIARDSEVTAAITAHEGASDPHPTYTTAAELAAFAQPLDSDLTAIAALTTTSFGRALLTEANAASARSTLDVPSNAEAILDALIDAKGDLLVGTAADTVARLGIGSNDQVLVADSGQSSGMKWAAVPGTSAFVPVNTIDAKGDLLVGSANDALDNLAVGSNGQVLTADSAQTLGVKWAAVSAVDPIAATFGAPATAFEFDSSSLTGLTAVGSPTSENANTQISSALYLRKSASGSAGWHGRYVGSLTTPFTVITKLIAFAESRAFNAAALFVGASDPSGGMHVLSVTANSDWNPVFRSTHWSNAVGGGGADDGSRGGFVQPPVYLAIVANSSDDLDYYYSYDGYLWIPLNESLNPSYTVGCCGLAVTSENGTYGAAAGFDFLRIWTSALTMPGQQAG